MGTNVYARRKLSAEIKEAVKNAIDADQYSYAAYLVDENSDEIHIGKRSCGWQFLFEENKECYENNRESINEFISRDDIILYNEYDDQLTPEIFWKDYVDCMNDGYTYKSYYQNHGDYSDYSSHEFINDNLRFSTDKDWC